MKLKMILFAATLLMMANVASAFSVKYSNKDSKTHTMEVKSNGSTQKVEFRSSTTGRASIQTSAKEVEIKTSCGWVKVKDDAKITIKDGCIKIE